MGKICKQGSYREVRMFGKYKILSFMSDLGNARLDKENYFVISRKVNFQWLGVWEGVSRVVYVET